MTTPNELAGLPEPAFQLRVRNGAYYVSEPNIGTTDCYTAEQMQAALSARDAQVRELVEAAREMDNAADYMEFDPDSRFGVAIEKVRAALAPFLQEPRNER